MMPTQHMTTSSLVANDNLTFGDIILVKFPFTNQTASKQRPSVVVSGSTYNFLRHDVVILAITSQMASAAEFAHGEITDWKLAGLIKPSILKPVLATIEQTLIIKKLGSLAAPDLTTLMTVLADIQTEPSEHSDP
jgi:mRNA interferase MazF